MKFENQEVSVKIHALQIFNEMLQNEQRKADQAVSAFNSKMSFGGTSLTALIRRPELKSQIEPENYKELAEEIGRAYIEESERVLPLLERGFTSKEVGLFQKHGIFYGIHVSPKLLALTEKLFIEHKELLLNGFPDPYFLYKYPQEVIENYFTELKKQRGLELDLGSIVLADTTTPRKYEGKKILNPCRLNEKLTELSKLTGEFLNDSYMNIDPLCFISTDTDSPHRMLLAYGEKPMRGYPLTPGLTMCGGTSSLEGLDFMYMYRIGLIAQSISSNIVASKITGTFSPFTFVGMLSPFGYEKGAIATGKMADLRYKGNINLKTEFDFQYKKNIERLVDEK